MDYETLMRVQEQISEALRHTRLISANADALQKRIDDLMFGGKWEGSTQYNDILSLCEEVNCTPEQTEKIIDAVFVSWIAWHLDEKEDAADGL